MRNSNTFQKLLDFLPSMVILTDGRVIKEANRPFFAFTGFDNLADFLARHDCICERFESQEGFLSNQRGRWREELMENQASNRPSFALMHDLQGKAHTFMVRSGQLEDNLLAVSFEDVTHLKESQSALEEANRLLGLQVQERTWELIESNEALEREKTHLQEAQSIAKLGHWSYRVNDHALEYAPQLLKIFELSDEKPLHLQNFLRTFFRRDRAAIFQMIRALESGTEVCPIDARVLTRDAQKMVRLYARSYLDDAGKPFYYLGACQDITEMMTLQEHAYRDPLTRAYNRRKVTEYLTQALSQERTSRCSVGLILLDVDYFKSINDTLGHDIGDRVLVEIAERTRLVVASEGIFCRWGGEEFMVALESATEKQVRKLADRIHRAIRTEDFDQAGSVTCSIGVVLYRPQERLHEGIKRCDDALYSAKRGGRDRVIVG